MSDEPKATGQISAYVVLSKDSKKIIGRFYTKSIELAQADALKVGGIATTLARAEKLGLPVANLKPRENLQPRVRTAKIEINPNRKAAAAFLITGEKAVRAVARSLRKGAKLNESQLSVFAAVGKFPDAAR